MTARRKPKTPLEHIARAQELIEAVEVKRSSEDVVHLNDVHLSLQLAHLHLRAAEVSAKLPPEVHSVADSISAMTLSTPVVGGVAPPPGPTPAAVAEAMRAERPKRRM